MTTAAPEQVAQLRAQLERAVAANDTHKVSSVAEKLLLACPTDIFAARCKSTVLLHQGRYDQALQVLSKLVDCEAKHRLVAGAAPARSGTSDEEDRQDVLLPYAYCLYRMNRLDDVKTVIRDAFPSGDVAAMPAGFANLLAQTHYNLEEYEEASGIYEALITAGVFVDEQEREEVVNNLVAAHAALAADKAKAALQLADEKTADMLYNLATALVEAKRFPEAMQLLDDAEKLAMRDFAAEHPQCARPSSFLALGEVQQPLPKDLRTYFEAVAMIQVQRAFIHFVLGDEAAAEGILRVVLLHKPNAVSTYAVACTNWAAIRRHNDFFDTHRKLKHAQQPAVEAKLTSRQRLLIKYNTAMLLLHTGRLAACRHAIDQMAAENSKSELVPLALVAVLLRDNKISKAEETLNKYFTEQQQHAGGGGGAAQLIIAQIKLEEGDLAAALAALRAVEKLRHRPAAIATLAEGYMMLGDANEARAVIADALLNIDAKQRAELNFWAGNFFAQHGLAEDAVKAYEEAARLNKSYSTVALPKMVVALAGIDVALAAEKAKKLPALSSSGDVAQVEQVPLPRAKLVELGFARQGAAVDIDGPRKAAKAPRRRPNRRPAKHADPTKRPDPERWIPINVRTYIVDLPPKRKRDLRRARAEEQYMKRRQAEKRRRDAAAAATTTAVSDAG